MGIEIEALLLMTLGKKQEEPAWSFAKSPTSSPEQLGGNALLLNKTIRKWQNLCF